jgi:N-acetyl-anhydromuramyl-L-alanine amidase AmpD
MPVVSIRKPSPNFNTRPSGVVIDAIVIHADSAPKVSQSLDWLRRKESKVSYHFLIGRHGDVYECVHPNLRAWHAGVSTFRGRTDVNDFSVGVSFGNKNDGKEPYTEAQYRKGAELCRELMLKYPMITKDRITTHAIISPGRKTDPGPRFDMPYFLSLIP